MGGNRVEMKFEVEMEENQVKALAQALNTGNAKADFQLAVASKLRELSSSTYSSVTIEVGSTSMETKDDITSTQKEGGSSSNIGMIIGIIVTLGFLVGLAYFGYQRSQHMAAETKEGTWKEEQVNPVSPNNALFQENGQIVTKSLSKLVFLDLEGIVEELLGLLTSAGNMHSNLLV